MNKVNAFTSKQNIEVQASDWLARLDSEEPLSDEQIAELKEWMNRSNVHRCELQRLAQFWGQANVLAELTFPLNRKQGSPDHRRFHWRSLTTVTTTCVLAIVLGISMWLVETGQDEEAARLGIAGNGVYETRIGEQNTITLLDGSVIEINTNSQIQVNYTKQQRVINLVRGEAHFVVSKAPDRPFEVTAGQGVVRAIGTAFAVRFDHEALKVTVTEGKVALAALAASVVPPPASKVSDSSGKRISNEMKAEALITSLVAGQSVLFEPRSDTPVPEKIPALDEYALEQQLAWRDGLLLFTGEPLSEVVAEINRYTTLNIEIIDATVGEISIGGQFKIADIDAILNVLVAKFNVDVRRIDADNVQLALKPY